MKSTEKGVIAGAAIGFGALLLWLFKRRREDEDRPAMTVKNGSIVFGFEDSDLVWEDGGGGTWEPDQDDGKDVKLFVATVTGADGKCPDLVGEKLTLTFTDESATPREQRFMVFVAGHKPKVSPKGLLTRMSSGKKLSHGRSGAGYISKIESDRGHSCTMSDARAEIIIDYVYD